MRITGIVLIVMILAGCAKDSGKESAADSTDTSTESLAPQVIQQPDANTLPNPTQMNVEADASGKVWHFVCADNCEGGHADAKGPCPVCGKELSHNQAFHNNSAQQNTQTTGGDGSPTINQTPQIDFNQPAEPPQNAQGVWHYTCPKGCVGGAGAAGPCATCGMTLTHNASYHN